MNQLKKIDFLVLFILIIGSILRFWGFSEWSLTNDELSALNRLNYSSFSELIEKGIWVDGHPAFVQIFLYYWTMLFGKSVFALRIPFILAGIGSLIYFYFNLKSWFNKNAAVIGLSFFAISQLYILYAQIARPYSIGLFFVLAFVYHFFQVIRFHKIKTNLILSIVFGLLGALTHYFSALQLAVVFLFSILYLNKKNVKYYLVAAASMVVLYLPHLPITLNHLSIGGVGWLPKPTNDFFNLFIAYLFNNSFVLGIGITVIALSFLFLKKLLFKFKDFIFHSLLFLVPFLIGYFYSIYKVPVIQFSVLIFCSPFLIFALFGLIKNKLNFSLTLIGSLIILFAGGFSLIQQKDFYSKKPFANFKFVGEQSVKIKNQLGAENILTIGNANNYSYLDYYSKPLDPNFKFDISDIKTHADIAKTINLIENSSKKYIMVSFANVPVPAEIHEFIKQKYSEVHFKTRYFNSEVIVYKRSYLNRTIAFETAYNSYNLNDKWNVNPEFLQDSVFKTDSSAYFLNAKTEYALTYKNTIENLMKNGSNCLTVNAFLKGKVGTNVNLAFNITRADSSVYWRGIESASYINNTDWNPLLFVFQKPEEILPTDLVTIFFWNNQKQEVFIDDFKIVNFADSDYHYYEL